MSERLLAIFFYNTDLYFENKHLHKYSWKRKEKKNDTIIIQQKNKIYTILGPTLKKVIARLYSSAAHM